MLPTWSWCHNYYCFDIQNKFVTLHLFQCFHSSDSIHFQYFPPHLDKIKFIYLIFHSQLVCFEYTLQVFLIWRKCSAKIIDLIQSRRCIMKYYDEHVLLILFEFTYCIFKNVSFFGFFLTLLKYKKFSFARFIITRQIA